IVGWVLLVELVPHNQAGFLENVLRIGPIRQEGQDIRVNPTLVLQEETDKRAAFGILRAVWTFILVVRSTLHLVRPTIEVGLTGDRKNARLSEKLLWL